MLFHIFLFLTLFQCASSAVCMERENIENDVVPDQRQILNLSCDIWENGILKELVTICYKYTIKNERLFLRVATPDDVSPQQIVNTKELRIQRVVRNVLSLSLACKKLNLTVTRAIPKIIVDFADNHCLEYHVVTKAFKKCSAVSNFMQQAKDLQHACQQCNTSEIKRLLTPETFAVQSYAGKSGEFLLRNILRSHMCQHVNKFLNETQYDQSFQEKSDSDMVDSVKLVLNFCQNQKISNDLLQPCIHDNYNQNFELLFKHNNNIEPYDQASKQVFINDAEKNNNLEVITFLLKD